MRKCVITIIARSLKYTGTEITVKNTLCNEVQKIPKIFMHDTPKVQALLDDEHHNILILCWEIMLGTPTATVLSDYLHLLN